MLNGLALKKDRFKLLANSVLVSLRLAVAASVKRCSYSKKHLLRSSMTILIISNKKIKRS